MNRDLAERHAKQIEIWAEQNIRGLAAERQLRVFGAAVFAVQQRVLVTLSEVTLNAVIDRVLYQSQQKYPLFKRIKLESNLIALDELQVALTEEQNRGADFTEAIRFFLTELFTILENITAGIMNKPLYQELSQVTANSQSAEDGEDK